MGMALGTLCSSALRVEENIQVKTAHASEFLSIDVGAKIKRFQTNIKISECLPFLGNFSRRPHIFFSPSE